LCMLCCATCTCYLLKRYNPIRYLTANEACARVLNLWKHPEQAEHAQQAHLLRTLLYSRGSNRYGCRWCTLCLLSYATCTRSRSCNRYPLKRRYPFRYLLIKEAEIMQLLPLRAARLQRRDVATQSTRAQRESTKGALFSKWRARWYPPKRLFHKYARARKYTLGLKKALI